MRPVIQPPEASPSPRRISSALPLQSDGIPNRAAICERPKGIGRSRESRAAVPNLRFDPITLALMRFA